MKKCSECLEDLSETHFHKNKDSPDGLHSKCKVCKNKKARNYYENCKEGLETPRKVGRNYRDYHLKKTYGISLQQYNELLEKQQHSCAVCGKHADKEKKSLAVDHNHKTGEIRGLLCSHCNYRVVGRWTDGTLLRKVVDYIEQGTGWFVPKKKRPVKRKPK